VRSQPECLICALKQVLKTAEFAGADITLQTDMLREAMDALRDVSLERSPAEISSVAIRSSLCKLDASDPFRLIKAEHTRLARSMYPHFERMVREKSDPLEAALRVAACANLIDLGSREDVELMHEMENEAERELKRNDLAIFLGRLRAARSILWIADNAGELVFDGLVLERLKGFEVWIGVKGAPILNDATVEDAKVSQLDAYGRVVTTGSGWLGVVKEKSSAEFLELLESADVVVAKGHANFETLDSYEREIFFLLKAKCVVVARELGVDVGDTVFVRNSP